MLMGAGGKHVGSSIWGGMPREWAAGRMVFMRRPTSRLMGNPSVLVRVEIRGLFGNLDHVLDFDEGEHLTILHGLNGTGKTMPGDV